LTLRPTSTPQPPPALDQLWHMFCPPPVRLRQRGKNGFAALRGCQGASIPAVPYPLTSPPRRPPLPPGGQNMLSPSTHSFPPLRRRGLRRLPSLLTFPGGARRLRRTLLLRLCARRLRHRRRCGCPLLLPFCGYSPRLSLLWSGTRSPRRPHPRGGRGDLGPLRLPARRWLPRPRLLAGPPLRPVRRASGLVRRFPSLGTRVMVSPAPRRRSRLRLSSCFVPLLTLPIFLQNDRFGDGKSARCRIIIVRAQHSAACKLPGGAGTAPGPAQGGKP
jgi:hypothetical protein